ncbi:MAG: LamG domain-containing protein, partial [Planctomycetota bacterium]
TADLTSFPVLINITGDPDLRTTANGGRVEDAEGDDIIFRASDGTTQLDHEVEKYDGSANSGVVARIDSNWSTGTGSGSQGPYTVPAASDSDPDRLLVFVTGFEDRSGSTPTIDGVTYGGVDMTRAATETYSGVNDIIVEIWYLKDNGIPAGSNSFSVSYNPAVPDEGVYHAWATFENVDQGDTILDTAVNNGANPIEATVSVVKGGMGVAAAINGSANGSYTWGNNWDEKDDRNGEGNGSTFSAAEHAQSSDGTDTASATHTDSTSQALAAVSIRPSPQLVAWVRIPTLKYNEDTIIYMYYGNSLISTSQENVSGVWANGYLGVWHLKEDPSGTAPQMQDSTSTNHGTSGGTMTSDDQLPGKFGGSLDFDGSDDEVDFSDAIIGDRSAWTITAWIQMGPDTADDRTIYSEGATTAERLLWLRVKQSNAYVGFWYGIGPDPWAAWVGNIEATSTPVEDNQFHYVAMVQRSKTNRELFVDNVSGGTNNDDPGTLTHTTASIGLLRTNYDADEFKGKIDEVRISNIDRSDDWLTTEHNNQSSPGTFYSIATEENTGTTGITLTGGTATGSATGATHTADAGGNSAPNEPTTPHINSTTAQGGQATPATGITDPTPAFSAIYIDPDSGDIANKYRIEVNTQSDFAGTELWDSGASGTALADTTAGNRSPDIMYSGSTLADSTTYYWRITFWDDDGAEGAVSATQQFTTGALSPVAIYYSVGRSTDDLKSGTPTMTIASGTATFSAAQPDDIGVGDVITYNTSLKAYISGRTSSTVYSVQTVTGGTPADVTDATVNSIKRTFNYLNDAALYSDDVSHLNTADLVTNNFQLNWPCYNDATGPDTTAVRIEEPWITGASNYIRAYTPTETSEVGTSQRHNGTAGTGYRVIPSTGTPGDWYNFILVSTDNGYVRIEGIEIDGSNVSG